MHNDCVTKNKCGIFISHSGHASTLISLLLKEVCDFKINENFCFLDTKSIQSSELWNCAIEDKIAEAEYMICLLDNQYFSSWHCGREYELAKKSNTKIICLKIDPNCDQIRSNIPEIHIPGITKEEFAILIFEALFKIIDKSLVDSFSYNYLQYKNLFFNKLLNLLNKV